MYGPKSTTQKHEGEFALLNKEFCSTFKSVYGDQVTFSGLSSTAQQCQEECTFYKIRNKQRSL